MVRAAAKNHASVAVVVDPAPVRRGRSRRSAAGGFTLAQRRRLAAKAFRHTAAYDIAVASWMGSVLAPEDDERLPRPGRRQLGARRRAALRREPAPGGRAVPQLTRRARDAEQLHGKEMSYNNYVDTDAAWRTVHDFERRAWR